jgi:hypothetical protein
LLAPSHLLSRLGRVVAIGHHRLVRSWFRGAPVVVVVPQRTADGPAVLRDDGGHVMALFPA